MTQRHGQPIDWDRIKQRLAAVGEALTRDRAVDIEQRRAMLEARTRALAQRSTAGPAADGLPVVEFVLGPAVFAIAASAVREVRLLTELTPLPCTPPFVSGIIHAHGRIIAVIDLRKFLSLPPSGLTDLNKVIILQHGDADIGILADRVVGTGHVAPGSLREPAGDTPRLRHLLGVTPAATLLLDAAGLLADPSLALDDGVSA